MSILDADFMRLALATGAVVGVLAPGVGFFLVQRRMSLIGDGIGHAAFAGVAAGYLLDVSPVAGALVASVLAAIGIEWLRGRHGTAGDQALALVFYTGIAAGVVLISAASRISRSSPLSELPGSRSSRVSIGAWSPSRWMQRERGSAGFRSRS
jgi:zinc transport system permease protein